MPLAGLCVLQFRLEFVVVAGDLAGKQRKVAAENNMRGQANQRLWFASFDQAFEQALKSKFSLGKWALIHGSEYLAIFNQRYDLLKQIGSNNLHLTQEPEFFQRFKHGHAIGSAHVQAFGLRLASHQLERLQRSLARTL